MNFIFIKIIRVWYSVLLLYFYLYMYLRLRRQLVGEHSSSPQQEFGLFVVVPNVVFFFLQMLSSNPVPCSKYIHVIQMVFHPYQYDLQPCYIYTECKSNDFCFSAQPHPPLPSYMLLSTFLVKKEGSFSFRISVISNQLFINLTDLIYLDLGNNLIGQCKVENVICTLQLIFYLR